MAPTNKAVPVFKIKKKHSWKDRLIRLVERLLILAVVVGTGIWLLAASHFSPRSFFSTLGKDLRPQATFESQPKVQSKEDQLRAAINQTKVLEIGSIVKTPQGDFQVDSTGGIVVIFSQNKDFAAQVATLQTLLAKARIDNKALKKVDFRFEKIVVEY